MRGLLEVYARFEIKVQKSVSHYSQFIVEISSHNNVSISVSSLYLFYHVFQAGKHACWRIILEVAVQDVNIGASVQDVCEQYVVLEILYLVYLQVWVEDTSNSVFATRLSLKNMGLAVEIKLFLQCSFLNQDYVTLLDICRF